MWQEASSPSSLEPLWPPSSKSSTFSQSGSGRREERSVKQVITTLKVETYLFNWQENEDKDTTFDLKDADYDDDDYKGDIKSKDYEEDKLQNVETIQNSPPATSPDSFGKVTIISSKALPKKFQGWRQRRNWGLTLATWNCNTCLGSWQPYTSRALTAFVLFCSWLRAKILGPFKRLFNGNLTPVVPWQTSARKIAATSTSWSQQSIWLILPQNIYLYPSTLISLGGKAYLNTLLERQRSVNWKL